MVEPNKITSNEQKLCPLLFEGRVVQQKNRWTPMIFWQHHRLCQTSGLSPCHFQAQLIGHTKNRLYIFEKIEEYLQRLKFIMDLCTFVQQVELVKSGRWLGKMPINPITPQHSLGKKTGHAQTAYVQKLRNFLRPGKLGKLPMRFGRHRERIWDTVKRPGIP